MMAEKYNHQRSEYICVDNNAEGVSGSSATKTASNLWPAETRGGASPSYVNNAEVPCAQCSSSAGPTYVRWGRTTCPAAATLLYAGRAAGAERRDSGGGHNYVCLHGTPKYAVAGPPPPPADTYDFTASFGTRNSVPERRYWFKKEKLNSTQVASGTYSEGMIQQCAKHGMKPVCDHPSYCRHDPKAAYLGQDHHIALNEVVPAKHICLVVHKAQAFFLRLIVSLYVETNLGVHTSSLLLLFPGCNRRQL